MEISFPCFLCPLSASTGSSIATERTSKLLISLSSKRASGRCPSAQGGTTSRQDQFSNSSKFDEKCWGCGEIPRERF